MVDLWVQGMGVSTCQWVGGSVWQAAAEGHCCVCGAVKVVALFS